MELFSKPHLIHLYAPRDVLSPCRGGKAAQYSKDAIIPYLIYGKQIAEDESMHSPQG